MTDHGTENEDLPADPAELLPDNSALSLDEYLEMYAAVGHRTRYEILYRRSRQSTTGHLTRG